MLFAAGKNGPRPLTFGGKSSILLELSWTASRASKASGQKSQQLCKDSWCKTKYFGGAAQLVAPALWGAKPSAAGGGCSEAEHAPRSKKSSRRTARGFFREPQAGRAKQAGRKVNNCARIVGAKLNISGCSAVGSALALGARCRVFESPHSDQVMMIRAA